MTLGFRLGESASRSESSCREFRIDLPRPRSLENHLLVDQAAEILSVLKNAMGEDEQEKVNGKSN